MTFILGMLLFSRKRPWHHCLEDVPTVLLLSCASLQNYCFQSIYLDYQAENLDMFQQLMGCSLYAKHYAAFAVISCVHCLDEVSTFFMIFNQKHYYLTIIRVIAPFSHARHQSHILIYIRLLF